MRVLVTGSSGLVGGALLPDLQRRGFETVPFDCRHDGADIRDPGRLAEAMQGCHGVVHLAAVSRVAWGESDPALCNSVNINGTANVIEAALAMRRPPWLIFASSREVYGCLLEVPAAESHPLLPFNTYGRSKAAGEALVDGARAAGLQTAILRLSSVYGSTNDHPDRAIPALLWNALMGRDLTISGTEAFFDFVHVEDCVRAFLTVAERLEGGAILPALHLASGVGTTLKDLAERAVAVAGSAAPVTVLPARSFDVSGFVGDPARAAEVIGWRSRIALAEGLDRLRHDLIRRDRPMDAVPMPPDDALLAPRPGAELSRYRGAL